MVLDTEPIYCAEQIQVPPQLAEVLKNYTKEVIRRQPKNLVEFSAYYFSNLASMIPAQNNCPPPTIAQIGGVYRAVANSGISRTCEIDAIQRETDAVGISQETLHQVLDVAQLGTTSAVDPVEVCVLLVTAATSDLRAMFGAIVDVFGQTGSLDANLAHDLFSALSRHDARFGGDFLAQLDEELGGVERVAHNQLLELPCVKALC